jgi:hypothetical protein
MSEMLMKLPERFQRKVTVCRACWIWTGATAKGYAHYQFEGKLGPGHRFSYEFFHGNIPDGLVLDHKCRNRLCVNPLHLEPVTVHENVKRSLPFRKYATACPNGHEYTDGSYYLVVGKRCKKCAATHGATRRKRAKTNIVRKPHWNSVKTHCPQGHEYTSENARFDKYGRSCRICARLHWRTYMAKKKASRLA